MDYQRPPQGSDLCLDSGEWGTIDCEEAANLTGIEREPWRLPGDIDLSTASSVLTENKTQWMPWKNLLSQLQQNALAQRCTMTVAEFVERKFVPEHVALKESSGRTHYQAMLKHVLTPEEVDRLFRVSPKESKKKLKAVPDWPYLSEVRLCDVQPDHVHRLTSAALERGYATQTVTHIRNVVSAIFSHARREQCFMGDNPVTQVKPPEIARKEPRALTFAQAKEVLEAMRYPEREMTLIALFTGMNVAEICGLQWRHVNLTAIQNNRDGVLIPPRTIAVRKQWYRGELGSVKPGRARFLPIPQSLLQTLIKLSSRPNFTGPDDFVLVSRAGTPANQTNILVQRLKPIAMRLQVPSLSWLVFRRTRKAWAAEFGIQFEESMAMMVNLALPQRSGTDKVWHCRHQIRQSHLGGD